MMISSPNILTRKTQPPQVIYEDKKHKFCILAHVYEGAKGSNPHDHGPSWAIYAQVEGVTTMTDWEKIKEPENGNPGEVRKLKDYDMHRGDAYLYNEEICIHLRVPQQPD